MSKEKVKKEKKEKKSKKIGNLSKKLRNQADSKNCGDCNSFLAELDQASVEGEYKRTLKLKVNQAHYLEKLGLTIKEEDNRSGFYEISWE